MANPRKRRLTQMYRLAQNSQLDTEGLKQLQDLGLLSQPAEELLKVSEEVPENTPLVEVELKVGNDEPNVVDELLLEELLSEKEKVETEEAAAEELSYSEKRKKAIAEKVASKNKEEEND